VGLVAVTVGRIKAVLNAAEDAAEVCFRALLALGTIVTVADTAVIARPLPSSEWGEVFVLQTHANRRVATIAAELVSA
jgi:hypothetical protein